MKTHFEQVAEFHLKFELKYEGPPRQLPRDMELFRIGFMIEELAEYSQACGWLGIYHDLDLIHTRIKRMAKGESNWYTCELVEDMEKQLDSLVDLCYVANGTAYLQGFNFDEAYRRVHEANMNKVRVESTDLTKSTRSSKYDVVKPEGWKAPDLSDLIK